MSTFLDVCLLSRQAPGFTYRAAQPLPPGTLVKVPFRTGSTWAIVWGEVPEPSFPTKEILEAPFETPLLTSSQMDLARWISEYYLAPPSTAMRHLLPGDGSTLLGLMGIGRKRSLKKRPEPLLGTSSIELNPRQSSAASALSDAIRAQGFAPFLLRGVTGSGKTAVFLEAARTALEAGRSLLYLVPEIGLTPQSVDRIRESLGHKVALFHSGLSIGERASAWMAVRNGEIRVVLGARSALFAPLSDPGLIVVDEEHDGSYKQDEAPRFHARDAAVWLARRQGCPIVLASATPSLESWKNAKEGRYTLLELPERAQGQPLPGVTILDRRKDPAPGILTIHARQALQETVGRGERAVVLLNRRGWSPSMECRSCGHSPSCPDCTDLKMVLHRRQRRLICHHCGWTELMPERCPACGSDSLDPEGAAIQKLEEEIQALVPGTPVIRLDRDVTAGRREELQERLAAFRQDGGILLGTQMIAKGHDFPAVTLVVAADGDIGSSSPDFRCNERTFQTLTQAAGRCGRDLQGGRVLLQTRSPDSPLLERVRTHDFLGFAQSELETRRELDLPPWSRIFLVEAASRNAQHAQSALEELEARLSEMDGLSVLGPIPAPLPVVRQAHRFHLVVKVSGPHPTLRKLLQQWLSQRRAPDLRCQVDVDPIDLL